MTRPCKEQIRHSHRGAAVVIASYGIWDDLDHRAMSMSMSKLVARLQSLGLLQPALICIDETASQGFGGRSLTAFRVYNSKICSHLGLPWRGVVVDHGEIDTAATV